MTTFETVRVAAIQATPVILDAEATIDKAIDLLNTAADDGVQLAVLPETFVSLYPSGTWAHAAARFSGFDELWERMWESSIDVPGPDVDRLAGIRGMAIESGALVVTGPQYSPRSAVPDVFPAELPDKEVFGNGGAAIIEPGEGNVIAGPLYGEEAMVVTDCDLRGGLHAKRF